MTVLAERIGSALARKGRVAKESADVDFNAEREPAPKTGFTTAQERKLEELLDDPTNPHGLAEEPRREPDGTVCAEVFSVRYGRHTVCIAPNGSLTRKGLDRP